jgi:hypothetical protein
MYFFTLTPCRLIDTRGSTGPLGGPALVAGAQRTFSLTGNCGVPSSARSLSLNITVTGPTAPGDLKFFAAGTSVPVSTTMDYSANQTRGNNAIPSLSSSGALTVQCDQVSGTVHLIVDVNGYFQ